MGWLFSGGVGTQCPGRLQEVQWPTLGNQTVKGWIVGFRMYNSLYVYIWKTSKRSLLLLLSTSQLQSAMQSLIEADKQKTHLIDGETGGGSG